MSETLRIERLIKGDRVIVLTALAALCALSWCYVLTGAGLGMSAWQMTTFVVFPHTHPAATMPGMDTFGSQPHWGPDAWALMIAMWWVMMIAMMLPSAAPAILLYARVYRRALAQGQSQANVAPVGVFLAGYLLAWLGFSIGAAIVHKVLQDSGLISAMMMGTQSRWLSAAVLLAAGLYQFSAIKDFCLARCRSPASFLTQHWRPGLSGALRAGLLHGAYCVGCCWLLMALLFVGGVMNLVWIAVLAVLVLLEKLLPFHRLMGRLTGGLLIAWSLATALA